MVRTLLWSWFLQQLWSKLLGRKTETLAVGHMQPIGRGRPEYAGLKNIKKLVRLLVEHVSARRRTCARSLTVASCAGRQCASSVDPCQTSHRENMVRAANRTLARDLAGKVSAAE